MRVLGLRCSGPVTSVCWEGVALQKYHMLKMVRGDACSRQARHPCPDHDRLPAH
jgi:hypothetical protein